MTDTTPPKASTGRKIGNFLRKMIQLIVYAHLIFLGIVAVISFFYINGRPPYTSLMLYRKGFSAEQTTFVPLHKISPTFQMDLINLEDGRFREHWGFDLEAIQRARELNKKAGYAAYGGSTLTQQLARTLFLTPHKNYLRKYLEILIAVELEILLRKDRILELYINYAELGDGVYGFNDAALHYYKRPFLESSTDQKMRLLTILASPINYNPKTFQQNRQLAKRYKFLYKYHRYH